MWEFNYRRATPVVALNNDYVMPLVDEEFVHDVALDFAIRYLESLQKTDAQW